MKFLESFHPRTQTLLAACVAGSFQTAKFVIKYSLHSFEFSGRLVIFVIVTKRDS